MSESEPLSGQKQVSSNVNAAEPTAVVVLGMHRSGTSAFARVASLLGCELPKNLMPADEGNDLGHWESNAVTALNERLLASAGSKWDDWTPLNQGWEKSAVSPAFLAEAQEVLRDDYAQAPLFVLKDPRICRLAPFWLKAIKAIGARAVIAFPLRNPYEVSNSLGARDGSDQGFGLLLWLRHVLEAEAATRELPRHFFTFQQLLADWGEVIDRFEKTTDMRFPRRSVAVEAEIAAFLSEDAWHERESATTALNAAAPQWVRETYAILKRWCDIGVDTSDYSRLDTIRVDFDAASPTFARLIARGVQTHGGFGKGAEARAELVRAYEQLQRLEREMAQAAEIEAALNDARGEMKRLREEAAQAAESQAALEAVHGETERLRMEIADAAEVYAALEESRQKIEQLEGQEAETKQVYAELASARDAIEQMRTAANQLQSEIEKARVETSQADEARMRIALEFQEMKDANHVLEAEVAKLTSAVRQRQEEAVQAWAKAELEHGLREKVEADQARLIRQNEELIAQFAAIEKQARADANALASARRRASDAEISLGQMSRQHQKMLIDLEAQDHELRQHQFRSARADAELAQLATLHTRAQDRIAELENIAIRADAHRAHMQERADAMIRQTQWLQEATAILQQKPRLRALLSSSARQQYSRDRLKMSGLFDAESYLEKNPDVASAGEDPLLHYVRHGLREGRPW